MEDLIVKLGSWSVLVLIGWWIVSAYVLNKINEFFKNRKFEKEKKFNHTYKNIRITFYQSKWAALENNTGVLCAYLWFGYIFFIGPLRFFNDFFEMIANLNSFLAVISLIIWIPIALLDNYAVNKYIKRYSEENLKND